MIRINIARHLLISLLLLLAIAVLETYSNIDLKIQEYFYDHKTGSWLLNSSDHKSLRLFFYDGPKMFVGGMGLSALAALVYSFKNRNRRLRGRALTLFLSIVLVPAIVAGGKQYTNVYCPKELVCFGGSAPYQRVLARCQSAAQASNARGKGRCFPAGHATGGFALMALFFCFKTGRRQLAGLFTGVAAGWAMGLYQMFRGEHFLSHTLASMVAAWIVMLLVEKVSEAFVPEIPRPGRFFNDQTFDCH